MLVSMESIPASNDAETTRRQSTCESSADVPIAAIADCATVFTALTDAAFNQREGSLFLFKVIPPFFL